MSVGQKPTLGDVGETVKKTIEMTIQDGKRCGLIYTNFVMCRLVSPTRPFTRRGRVWSNSHHNLVPCMPQFSNKHDVSCRIVLILYYVVTTSRFTAATLELLFSPTYALINYTVSGTRSCCEFDQTLKGLARDADILI